MRSKAELRQYVRREKERFSRKTLREMSLPVVAKLLALPIVANAKTVLAYASLSDEVCTDSLLDSLVKEGKTVLLPKVLDAERMEIRQYTGKNDLKEGAFHIMEPIGEPFNRLNDVDVAIIPGMSFDQNGHRLGRGKGYYDRFLAQLPSKTVKVGACFSFQMMDNIENETHDVVMDFVVC